MVKLIETLFSAFFVYSILRVTTPILFAALGAVISDRAGVINIGLEGLMLIAGFTGVAVSAWTQSAWLGMLAGVLASILFALMMGYFHLKLKTDIILAGIALNLMASGGTIFMLYVVAGDKGISSSLASKTMPQVILPLIDKIPVLGPMISNHNVLTYMAFLSVFLVWYFMYRMPLGLQLRAVGENPDAADSVGINVHRVQYLALGLSGLFAGLGGVHLSMGYVSWFSRDMTVGRGFISLAAAALGGNTPVGVLIASVFFGTADALSNYLQSMQIPSEFVQMIPHLVTVIALALYARQKKLKRDAILNRGGLTNG